MKRTIDSLTLDQKQLSFLLERLPPRLFREAEELARDGQVPLAGYALLKGKITFEKKKQILKELDLNSVICVRELMQNIPLDHTIKIAPGSEAIILDKSSVLEILSENEGRFLIPASTEN